LRSPNDSQLNFIEGPAPTVGVTCTAALPAREHTVHFPTRLLTAERARRGTRPGPARYRA